MKNRRGERRVFLEVFAGSGRLSQDLRRRGHGVVSLDLAASESHDLLRTAVFDEIKGWILAGFVWGIFLGTPCGTFSRARRGRAGGWPEPLRDETHPRGLPDLPGEDRRRVNLANLIADRAFVLYRIAAERGLLAVEENPAASWLWSFMQRKVFETKPEVFDVMLDHSAFGTPYRARTRFRFSHCGRPPELQDLRCKGRGTCDFSEKPHVHLARGLRQRISHGTKSGVPERHGPHSGEDVVQMPSESECCTTLGPLQVGHIAWMRDFCHACLDGIWVGGRSRPLLEITFGTATKHDVGKNGFDIPACDVVVVLRCRSQMLTT